MAITQTLEKYPSESRMYDFNFANLLEGDDLVSDVDSIEEEVESGTESDGLTVGDGSVNGDVVTVRISEGTAGVTYKITCTVTTSKDNTLTIVGFLKVLSE